MNWKVVFVVFVAALMAAFPASAVSLITDGNFDNIVSSGSFDTYGVGALPTVQNLGNDWVVSAGSVDVIHSYWNLPPVAGLPSGAQSVDLNGNTLSPATIRQTVALTAGQQYTVTFWMSGNPDGSPIDKQLQVQVGQVSESGFNVGGTSPVFDSLNQSPVPSLVWQEHSWTFTASQNANAIQFSSLVLNGNYGPVVADISLTATPEPGAVVLFGTLTGALALFVRRRRKA